MKRRSLLKAGLAGSALLGVGGAALLVGRDPQRDRALILGAVVPALLDGALPVEPAARTAAIERVVDGVGVAIGLLAPSAQTELERLFTLLALAPGRRLLAGVGSDWPQASIGEVAGFLEGWRVHRSTLFRAGYAAIHDLVLGTWYADESAWSGIGYAGPLSL
jgi:hypothetical protein